MYMMWMMMIDNDDDDDHNDDDDNDDNDDDDSSGKRMTNRSILSLLQSVQRWDWARQPKSSSLAWP